MKIPEARIPLLSLAEYMVARVERRATIVTQTMERNDAAGLRYSRAREELVRILKIDRAQQSLAFADAAESFRSRAPNGDWDASDLACSAEAMDRLHGFVGIVDLGDRPPRRIQRWPLLRLEGVGISVTPNVLVRTMTAVPSVGGVKFRFSKGRAMTEEEGRYAATILRYYFLTKLKDDSQRVTPKLCQVVDIFSGQVFAARNAYKRDMGKVRLACAEIRARWIAALLEAPVQPSTQVPVLVRPS